MSEKRTLTLAAINDITTRINSEQDLPGLLTVIMETARQLLNTEAASLLLYDPEREELIFDIVRGPRGGMLANKRIPKGRGIAGLCAEKKEPIIVDEAQTDPRVMRSFDAESNFTTRNLLAVPMIARGDLIGVLEVVNTSDGRKFERHDINLMNYLANMALGPLVGAWLDHLGNQYRYTFLGGSILAALSVALGLWVHARWLLLGGRQEYVAPE